MPSFRTQGYPNSLIAEPVFGGGAELSIISQTGNTMSVHLDGRILLSLTDHLNTLIDDEDRTTTDNIGNVNMPERKPTITHISTCADAHSVYTTAALSDGRILSMANVDAEWFELPPIPPKEPPP